MEDSQVDPPEEDDSESVLLIEEEEEEETDFEDDKELAEHEEQKQSDAEKKAAEQEKERQIEEPDAVVEAPVAGFVHVQRFKFGWESELFTNLVADYSWGDLVADVGGDLMFFASDGLLIGNPLPHQFPIKIWLRRDFLALQEKEQRIEEPKRTVEVAERETQGQIEKDKNAAEDEQTQMEAAEEEKQEETKEDKQEETNEAAHEETLRQLEEEKKAADQATKAAEKSVRLAQEQVAKIEEELTRLTQEVQKKEEEAASLRSSRTETQKELGVLHTEIDKYIDVINSEAKEKHKLQAKLEREKAEFQKERAQLDEQVKILTDENNKLVKNQELQIREEVTKRVNQYKQEAEADFIVRKKAVREEAEKWVKLEIEKRSRSEQQIDEDSKHKAVGDVLASVPEGDPKEEAPKNYKNQKTQEEATHTNDKNQETKTNASDGQTEEKGDFGPESDVEGTKGVFKDTKPLMKTVPELLSLPEMDKETKDKMNQNILQEQKALRETLRQKKKEEAEAKAAKKGKGRGRGKGKGSTKEASAKETKDEEGTKNENEATENELPGVDDDLEAVDAELKAERETEEEAHQKPKRIKVIKVRKARGKKQNSEVEEQSKETPQNAQSNDDEKKVASEPKGEEKSTGKRKTEAEVEDCVYRLSHPNNSIL